MITHTRIICVHTVYCIYHCTGSDNGRRPLLLTGLGRFDFTNRPNRIISWRLHRPHNTTFSHCDRCSQLADDAKVKQLEQRQVLSLSSHGLHLRCAATLRSRFQTKIHNTSTAHYPYTFVRVFRVGRRRNSGRFASSSYWRLRTLISSSVINPEIGLQQFSILPLFSPFNFF